MPDSDRILCSHCGKSVSTPVPPNTHVRAFVECPECIEGDRALAAVEPAHQQRMAELFRSAALDNSLTDREVRNIVRYISLEPLSERDIARTKELAERFGWS